jgi:hypothetical protein
MAQYEPVAVVNMSEPRLRKRARQSEFHLESLGTSVNTEFERVGDLNGRRNCRRMRLYQKAHKCLTLQMILHIHDTLLLPLFVRAQNGAR